MKLCIDPGHGFSNATPGTYDPGAIGGGLEEADIALDWALTGKWVLNRAGIAVWLTRDDDRDASPLAIRDERAHLVGCTHFLSLHCNAAAPRFGTRPATGTEVFWRDVDDMRWASHVLAAALPALGLRNRGLKTEGLSPRGRLSVFDFDGSAALLELGFITNARDRAAMTRRENRVAFWERLASRLNA